MHGSHKFWIWGGIFIVVLGFLLGMYFSATPESMEKIVQKRQAIEKMKQSKKNTGVKYEETTPQGMINDENKLPDEPGNEAAPEKELKSDNEKEMFNEDNIKAEEDIQTQA